jgi:hypothetical protein
MSYILPLRSLHGHFADGILERPKPRNMGLDVSAFGKQPTAGIAGLHRYFDRKSFPQSK